MDLSSALSSSRASSCSAVWCYSYSCGGDSRSVPALAPALGPAYLAPGSRVKRIPSSQVLLSGPSPSRGEDHEKSRFGSYMFKPSTSAAAMREPSLQAIEQQPPGPAAATPPPPHVWADASAEKPPQYADAGPRTRNHMLVGWSFAGTCLIPKSGLRESSASRRVPSLAPYRRTTLWSASRDTRIGSPSRSCLHRPALRFEEGTASG